MSIVLEQKMDDARTELDTLKRHVLEAKDACRAVLEKLAPHVRHSPGDQTRAIACLFEAIDEFAYDDRVEIERRVGHVEDEISEREIADLMLSSRVVL